MIAKRKQRVDVAAEFAKFDAEVHPAAKLIRLPTEEEFLRIEASIRERGQQIAGWRLDGLIIDGRTRRAVAQRLKEKFSVKDVELADGETPTDLVLDCNVNRRQLTPAECRSIVRRMLKEAPERSDRAIGEKTGVDHKTVGKSRKKLEQTGEIPQFRGEGGRGKRQGQRVASETAKSAPVDSLGKVIPEALRELFADAGIPSAIAAVDKMLRTAEAFQPILEATVNERRESHAPFLKPATIIGAMNRAVHELKTAKRKLQDARPYAVAEGKPGWMPFEVEE